MKHFIAIPLLLTLVACGKDGANGINGKDGASVFGLNAVSTGIDFEDISGGLVCANGGISVFTFRDVNSDGLFQSDEQIIKVKAICHGLNGQDGEDGADGSDGQDGTNSSVTLEAIASSSLCPNGGVKIYASGSAPAEICNGVNGLNGEQGIPGVQGIPGLN